jgi:threonine synthase
MRFIDDKGELFGLMDAAARGSPLSGPAFFPAGDADLRPAVYAPDSSYQEAASSAIAALFPEDVDPLMAERFAARAFAVTPAEREYRGDILVADYTAGPSASVSDCETALLAGILAGFARHGGPRLLLADGSGPEGASLAEATAGLRDLSLVLLYPEGQEARGIKGQRLAREGGRAKLLTVQGDRRAVEGLIREAAGTKISGMGVTAAGPGNPARVAARIVMLAATFSILRKGARGDIFMGVRAGDGLGFAACLWAWRLGLPISGIVLSVGEKGVLGLEPAGRFLVERFDSDRPGVIRSLALLQPVTRAAALRAREAFLASGGPDLDLASAMSLAAAELALEAGLQGHARIVVPFGAAASWDPFNEGRAGPSSGLRDARVDAEIGPSLSELERALTV